jgi:hypothetical protein
VQNSAKYYFPEGHHCNHTGDAKMPEYIQAIEKFLSDNPNLGKAALVELLTARFPKLNQGDAWILVTRYCNDKSH